MTASRRVRAIGLGATIAAMASLAPSPVVAGSTNPVLVLGHAQASGAAAARIVDLTGSWGFDDVMQLDYPLNVVVRQGTNFVRYPVGAAAVAGSFAGLADGLSVGEIAALEGTGSAAADASISRLSLHEMTLLLPPSFSAGPLEVQLYVELPGEGSFLSNSIQTVGTGS